ncbi:FAD-dependent oxidoreductase [Olivibacter sp. SDN3]|uniref:FAD-dependent oxidoreductase n=1 Tax=Olivibacter sp. SDN3 TaxID=2764720 RepID=UPI001651138C|nr:FAD-dependent oxidoreductase [Olivibacter sp. SDN3]QNL51673.1 FAD-dependent oxidoreductase [Olivibacter sp. SDN3]
MKKKTKQLIELEATVFKMVVFIAFLTSFAWGCSGRAGYDIVIYGSGSSGFIAAIQAAELGKSVALVEPGNHIGGLNVEGLGGTDIDNHPEFQNSPAVGGLALEFYRRIANEYGVIDSFDRSFQQQLKNSHLWRFEPSVAEKVINKWLGEYDIQVYTGERLSEDPEAVRSNGSRILSFKTESGTTFKGKVFIDATLEGDLLAAAGISTVVGRESNQTYSETRNGIRAETTHGQFAVDVDPYLVPGDSTSGLIPTIRDEPLGEPGSRDHRLQAYCFRVCLSQDPENQIPFRKPDNYDRTHYEIYVRYLKSGGKLYRPRVNIPHGKTDLNGGGDLTHNLYGMNYEYPTGNYEKRQEILQYHRDYTEGLFYFLAHDDEIGQIAPDLQQAWASWGLAKDEFTDNNGWPRMLYVRDARRMVSDYVITEHHVSRENGIAVEDPVALAYWPADVHSVRRIVRNGKAYNEGFVFGGEWWKPLGIAYRALVPKKKECTNLIAPTCPSSSHIAYGAIRIEFTFMALGQAAATAASLAIDGGFDVQEVPYNKLQGILLKQGQVLQLNEGY